MTILETPKAKPKRDQSRAFDLWLSKYPQIKPKQINETEWRFGEMYKDGKTVSLINFAVMPDNVSHVYDLGEGNADWVRNIDVEMLLHTINIAYQKSVPLVHLLYFPKTDVLLFKTIWKDGVKTEIKMLESDKHIDGLAKVYLTNPNIIEGRDD